MTSDAAGKPRGSRLLARVNIALRLIVLVPATLVLLGLQLLAVRFSWPMAKLIPMLFHRMVLWLLGVRVRVRGAPSRGRPLLLCSNHVSWLDIDILGSLFPLSFIAKSEVAGWPIFGLFAKLQRTIFVDRKRRTSTGTSTVEIAQRLNGGDALVLFAEGTSSDGNRVLPFRAALLGGARDAMTGAAVTIQPLAIVYRGYRGLPMGRDRRPLYCWYGDMELAPHLLGVLADGVIDVTLCFGEPVPAGEGFDRKAIAAKLEQMCRAMLTEELTGRPIIPAVEIVTAPT